MSLLVLLKDSFKLTLQRQTLTKRIILQSNIIKIIDFMSREQFKNFDYRKYGPTPFYLPGDPATDHLIIQQKEEIQSRLKKYKYHQDFDKQFEGHDNHRLLFTQALTATFFISIFSIPMIIKGHYHERMSMKLGITNFAKLLTLFGIPAFILYKSMPQVAIYDRNPLGRISGSMAMYKGWSYDYNMYQNVKDVKEQFPDQTAKNYIQTKQNMRDNRLPKIYGYCIDFLRDNPSVRW